MSVERVLSDKQRLAWRERNRWRWERKHKDNKVAQMRLGTNPSPSSSKASDSADQLRVVMAANFTVQPLLNKSEARVFRELQIAVNSRNPSWQVMAQVSMGEMLRSEDATAYSCINSKRVDLLLVDGNCQPRHAVEYQGAGHHQGVAAARDAVKKEALRRAGIGYYEVVRGHTTPADLKRLVEKLVDKPPPSR